MKIKKSLELVGNFLVILSFIFLIKKFSSMDFEVSSFYSLNIVAAILVSVVVQTSLIVIGFFPWSIFIESFSGIRIPYMASMKVYVQSNLYKYLPGNFLQYVGRNKLASDFGISHFDVAIASILDIFFCIFACSFFVLLTLDKKIALFFECYVIDFIPSIMTIWIVSVVMMIILFFKYRQNVYLLLSRYIQTLKIANKTRFLAGILFYFFNVLVSLFLYIFVLYLLNNNFDVSDLIYFAGSFVFAWLIGFIMIGAPAGVGIRESVMLFASNDHFIQEIMIFILIMRLSSIFADIIGFLIGKFFCKCV